MKGIVPAIQRELRLRHVIYVRTNVLLHSVTAYLIAVSRFYAKFQMNVLYDKLER